MSEIVAAFFGFMVATIVFSRVILWIGICVDVALVKRRPWQVALSMSLFHSAPWLLLLTVFFAFNIWPEPWAGWFVGGLIVAFALQAIPVIRAFPELRKSLSEDRETAP